jgi:curved DNA-binding protein
MNYYQILGIGSDASADDIKKAYRKLAMQHHPDRTGGDETEFKKIQEAYDILGDPAKRSQYDNPATGFGGQSDIDFSEIFSMFGFDGFGHKKQNRNPDSRIDISVTLQQAISGTDYHLNLKSGSVNIKIPAGVRAGTKFKLPGKGAQRIPNLPPGDLLVVINVDMPPEWGRQNDDLFVRIQIDALSAMLGTTWELDHINGKRYKVEIPPGIQPGEKVRLKGLGMLNPQNSVLGSLYVVVTVFIPSITDPEDVNILTTIRGKINGQ